MERNGRALAQIIQELKKNVKPGVTTEYLNKVAEDLIFKFKAGPSFKNYQGFPAVLCTSVNEEAVHVAPSGRELKEGDIISLDLGIFRDGFHADMAITMPVGSKTNLEALRLIRVTKKALKRGIKKVRPGSTVGDIGNTVQRYVENQGYSVIRELCGHGIGKRLHEDPQIPNYGRRKTGPEIKEGMVLCLEPIIAMGRGRIKRIKDGHGYKTEDNSLSAHFEHMVVVTKYGCRVLTD